MSNKSDKPLVRNMIIGCVIAILVFHFGWSSQLGINLHNFWFTLIDGGLIGAFTVEAIGAYKYADNPNKEWKRLVAIGLAVVISLWAGGWAAYVNEKIG